MELNQRKAAAAACASWLLLKLRERERDGFETTRGGRGDPMKSGEREKKLRPKKCVEKNTIQEVKRIPKKNGRKKLKNNQCCFTDKNKKIPKLLI